LNTYEFDFIATSSLSGTEVENLINGLVQFFSDNSLEVIKKEYWGLIDFKYKIRKFTKGHYFMFYLKAPAANLKEVERKLKLNNLILRYLILRVSEKEIANNMEEPVSLKLAI